MAIVDLDGKRHLENKTDLDGVGRFELTQPTIIWRFSREQLVSEIKRLQEELDSKHLLLSECDRLSELKDEETK